MSAKWHRSRAWDDSFFPAWAGPLKWLLRTFSGIPLAVVLLSLVVVYATLASVPIGLLAQIPTWAFYGMTLLVSAAGAGLLGGWGAARLARASGAGARWASVVVVAAVCGGGAVVAWLFLVWPHLRYDWGTHTGLMFGAEFCERFGATTLRRLPSMEMTEIEFYAWWPLRVVLLLFVANMVTATVRRIEFRFVNLGVLLVHTGIVSIALGSIYYGSVKQEGDVLLLAGPPDQRGHLTPGPTEDIYYDAIDVALHVRTPGERWIQLPLWGVPRYNNRNLLASAGETMWDLRGAAEPEDSGPPISIEAPAPPDESRTSDLRFRAVAYNAYATGQGATDWLRVDPEDLTPSMARSGLNPLREVTMSVPVEDSTGAQHLRAERLFFLPRTPSRSAVDFDLFSVEYAIERDPQRQADLMTDVPEGTRHALIVEIPGETGPPMRQVFPLKSEFTRRADDPPERIEVGTSGYVLEVEALDPRPTLAIVTPGYEGATSSVARVRVRSPRRADGTEGESYTRWVYSRFPEISQDLLDETRPDGRPIRRDPDPSIRITYLDLSGIRFYFNERADGTVDLMLRAPDGVTQIPNIGSHEAHHDLVRLGDRWEHAERFERTVPVPAHQQDKRDVGTHARAALGVEVTSTRYPNWKRIVWAPFVRYLDRSPHEPFRGRGPERWVVTPDGRVVELAFGRQWRRFEGFELQLLDFDMIEYEHRGAPRDYISTVRVLPKGEGREAFEHVARLNAPLRAPFNVYNTTMNPVVRFFGRLMSGLDPGQFKLSQSGWDQQTWQETRAMADRGEIDRPFVEYTILHVGNNPGIHIIALGGILMGVGIPWAFYVKPWLLRRAKRRIQRRLALENTGKATSVSPDHASDQRPVGV
ncbi:MAG: hypothetical protein H6811_05700 [Phycisphaeraceae bacterium]|nr:hypothetical protein [Phycisphaeraceae bacterium]